MLPSYFIHRKSIIKSPSRCVCFIAATLVFLLTNTNLVFPQNSVPVLFSGPIERSPYKIYLDGLFVGYMGDAINAPLGQHSVIINGPYGAKLNMNLNFGIGWISNSGVVLQQPGCWNDLKYVESWSWHYEPLTDRTIIHIEQPVIGMRSKIMPCPRYRLKIFRNLGKVKISFKSKPDKAIIMIDGKRKGTTPKTLGVIYRENTNLITVVVRKEGYINFIRQLRPPFPDEKDYECILRPF